MQAMILAAGFGTRLLPYTTLRPKPLFPLLNTPLLLLTIERLQKAGCNRIIVNAHHLRQQIAAAVSGIEGVELQLEDEILGTGGGLRKALVRLDDEPLLISNGDIYHNVDLQRLYEEHVAGGGRVTMAVHDCPRFNTISYQENRITGFAKPDDPDSLAFTGLHVIQPEVLEAIAKDRKSCIIERYRELLREDRDAISLVRIDGACWTDMGTVEDYLHLHEALLKGEMPCWQELSEKIQDSVLIADGVELGAGTKVYDWASIGKARIGRNVIIRRSVIWDGAEIADNSVVEEMIVAA